MNILSILKDTLQVTSFVLITMLIIEYFSVLRKGSWLNRFRKDNFKQVIFSSLLGLTPGCFGAITAVSLFTHGIFSFASLVAAMIASTGDEAFVMIALIPGAAWKIFLIVLFTAILSGWIISFIFKKRKPNFSIFEHLKVHQDEPEYSFFKKSYFVENFKKVSFQRVLLLMIGGLVLFSSFFTAFFTDALFEKILFASITLLGLYIIAIVPDHFLQEHIWDHIFREHILRILLWTFGTLLFIQLVLGHFHMDTWVKSNQLIMLLIAVAVGIIPESGPHILFISLFAKGAIPLSVLVANSIIQDGHGGLPLLAESKKGFIAVKATNMVISLIVGMIGYYTGW